MEHSPHEFLKPAAVAQRLGMSRSTVYKLMATDRTFPTPIRLLPRSPRWRTADIDRWVESPSSPWRTAA